MKTFSKNMMWVCLVVTMVAHQGFSQEFRKLAQTGFKFLSVETDARASAMGGALTAVEGNSTALFINPASMARMDNKLDFALGQVQWIADINYVFGSAAFRPKKGQWGVFGISMLSVDYGKMYNTILADNEQGFLDLGEFSPLAYAVGLGYAKTLTDRFMIGGHMKYSFQSLGGGIVGFNPDQTPISQDFELDVFAYDFGLLYRTGYKSLSFGMNIRNFSQEVTYIEESFQLPLTFEMGVSMNVLELSDLLSENHRLNVAVDAVHPRDFGEQINLGLEYIFLNTVALRFGYTTPTDEQGINLGAGLAQNLSDLDLNIDYAYTDFGIFNAVHRFTFSFGF